MQRHVDMGSVPAGQTPLTQPLDALVLVTEMIPLSLPPKLQSLVTMQVKTVKWRFSKNPGGWLYGRKLHIFFRELISSDGWLPASLMVRVAHPARTAPQKFILFSSM
jgi:hypothetical protein